jgi:hypothetical protein
VGGGRGGSAATEGAKQAEMDPDIDEEEEDDGWHDAIEDAPPPGH